MFSSTSLDEQVIQIKRGRRNELDFEPAFDSYFDFYLDSRYFGEPLLKLQDVTFHLFLRRQLNDRNNHSPMPTIRQIHQQFGISNSRIYAMLDRLAKAHLLNKASDGEASKANLGNAYILRDPIQTLPEFLTVAQAGLFRFSLLPEYATGPAVDDEKPGFGR